MKNKMVLEKEEIEEIINIQDTHQAIIEALGKLEIKIIEINLQKENLKNTLINLKKQETDLLTKLENKYGKGEILLDTGEFVPY